MPGMYIKIKRKVINTRAKNLFLWMFSKKKFLLCATLNYCGLGVMSFLTKEKNWRFSGSARDKWRERISSWFLKHLINYSFTRINFKIYSRFLHKNINVVFQDDLFWNPKHRCKTEKQCVHGELFPLDMVCVLHHWVVILSLLKTYQLHYPPI